MALPAAIIGSSVIGGIASSSAASDAASAQSDATKNASAVQAAQYQQTRNDLLPYNASGQGAVTQLNKLLGIAPATTVGSTGSATPSADWGAYLNQNPDVMAAYNALSPQEKAQFPSAQAYAQYHYGTYGQKEGRSLPTIAATGSASGGGDGSPQATLEATPGYQFTLSQGLRGIGASAAARGLGISGAALKGATNFAGQTANQTYGDTVNRLMSVASLGENAGAQTGSFGTTTASNIGNNITSAGNASAASSIASGNAITGAASSVPSAFIMNQILSNPNASSVYANSPVTTSHGPY